MKKSKFNFALKCTFFCSCLAVGLTLLFAEDSSKRLAFINESLKYLGTPYKYASASKKGMDCSGLVYKSALESIGLKLPRSAAEIAKITKKVNPEDMQAGDLVFFNTFGNNISHVGIYLGQKQFLHSASAGNHTGVITSSLDENYWKNRYLFAGRILPKENILIELDDLLQKPTKTLEKETQAKPQDDKKQASSDEDRVKELVSGASE